MLFLLKLRWPKTRGILLARIFNKIHLTLITLLVFACCVVIFTIHCELRVEGVRKNRWNHHNVGWVVPLEHRDTQCWEGAVFLGKSKSGFPNPNTDFAGFLGNSKNGSWIHEIHTLVGFFGSNPNSDFWDSQSERFLGKGFENSIFVKRFSEQKWYTTDSVTCMTFQPNLYMLLAP